MNQTIAQLPCRRWLVAVAATGLSGLLQLSNAAESPPANTNAPSIALDALVADVLEHNPELNFYRAEIAAAKGERRTAATWANPEVSTTVGQKQVRSGGLSDEGVAWSVSVQQTFEYPGRLALRKAIANRQIELAGLGYEQFKGALAARARELAFSIFIAQENAEAAHAVADRYQALAETMVQREPAGVTPLLETRILEANALIFHRHASQATLSAQSEVLELNQLRGQPLESPVRVSAAELKFPAPLEIGVLLAAARTNNFELRMRQAELAQQGFSVSLAKNERFPSVTIGPFLSEESAADKERILGVGISVPVPLWNRNAGKIQTANARLQQAQTLLRVSQLEVERAVTTRAAAYQTKTEEMSHWRADAVQRLREAAELADRHYRLGAVPIATYVELQKQYLDGLEAVLETRHEALAAAQELQRLTGINLNAAPPAKGESLQP